MTAHRSSPRSGLRVRLHRALAATGLALAALPAAADAPVVVELYTSQGCSTCPPADALLAELAARDDVIALGLHVDYWDYIGWTDVFADPAHTRRQKAYAHEAGERMIYTPQMVIDGGARMAGHDRGEVERALESRRAAPRAAALDLQREGARMRVRGEALAWPGGSAELVVVTYMPSRTVSILSGENAGNMLDYANVVTGMRRVATWDGADPLDVTVEVPAEGPVAVLLQREGPGEVLAAAKLD